MAILKEIYQKEMKCIRDFAKDGVDSFNVSRILEIGKFPLWISSQPSGFLPPRLSSLLQREKGGGRQGRNEETEKREKTNETKKKKKRKKRKKMKRKKKGKYGH